MATRLVHPIRSSGRRGWRGPVSDARGRVRSGLGRSTGWARLGSPVDGGGRVRNPRRARDTLNNPAARLNFLCVELQPTDLFRPSLARGVRGSGPSSTPTRITRLPSCSRASTPSTAARGRDADQGPNTRSEASTDLPRTGHPHMTVSTVWAGAGRRPWQHSMQRWPPAMLTTRPSTTALSESARHLQCSAGSPLHFRRQGGTLFRRPSAGDCRFERSPGNWGSIVPWQRSTWKL